MPHVLIAGATGAGKSSLINTFVTSVLMRDVPDEVKLVLVDPKRVELSHFADLPHLITPVIVHPKDAGRRSTGWCARWSCATRCSRWSACAISRATRGGSRKGRSGFRRGRRKSRRLPYILVVVDELADLMMVAPRDVEDAICRIARMAARSASTSWWRPSGRASTSSPA